MQGPAGAVATITLPLTHVGATAFAADLPGDPFASRDIAEGWCAEPQDLALNGADMYEGAPAFQTIADDPGFMERALRAFLPTSHDEMPAVMPRPEPTGHIIAYILSLKRR